MADPVVELEPATAAVEPGGQTRVVVTVINEGTIVEGYRVEVLDDMAGAGPGVAGPASWSEVLSAEGGDAGAPDTPDVTVYPGQQQSVVVVFSPPVGTKAPGGRCAFAIRVSSVVDADTSTVVEGDLEVGKVSALQAKVVPVTSKGRWHGRHVVELSNWGNTPVRLTVAAEDPDRALGFLVQPETVELPVGATAPVRLRVRTRHPRLRGPATRLPFTVRARPADRAPGTAPTVVPGLPPGTLPEPDTATVDGAFTQKSIVTTGTAIGAGLAVVGVAALTAYGFSLRGGSGETFEELGVPDTPEITVEAQGPDTVRVSWPPVENIEGYKLYTVDAEGVRSGEPVAVDPDVGAMTVADLEPEQEYCFSLVAVRGEINSPGSATQCAQTEEAVAAPTTEDGASETSEETSVDPGGGTTEPEATTDVPPTDPTAEETGGETATDEPGETTAGEPTGPTVPTVPPPPPVDEPPFEAGEWAAVLVTFPAEGSAGEFAANQRVDALGAEGVAALAVATDEYPDLGFAQQGWLVVMDDGFASAAEATQACQDVQAALPALVPFCDPPVQPVAASAGQPG